MFFKYLQGRRLCNSDYMEDLGLHKGWGELWLFVEANGAHRRGFGQPFGHSAVTSS